MKKFTVTQWDKSKKTGHKIAVLTAYDYTTAKLLNDAEVEVILVGDSLGMVMLGYENTLQVTMNDMLHHVKAVTRGAKLPFVIADMPFMSYHTDVMTAVVNAGRFIQEAGADAVKLEGGIEMVDKVKAIVQAQIPVIGHLGLTPQSIHLLGGFKVQGKSHEKGVKILSDALALEAAGVTAIVLECVPEALATLISEKLSIPTIGIGSGAGCDGQVLVIQDMLGTYDGIAPRFVKHYAELGEMTKEAVKCYQAEVREGIFPEKKHSFEMDDVVIEGIKKHFLEKEL